MMSTERFPRGVTGSGPEPVSNDFESVVMDGDLFIRELAESSAPARRASERDERDEDGKPYTTLALGEEGRGEEESEEDGLVTTLALGEEGDRGGDER
jgi:hypothetical protein